MVPQIVKLERPGLCDCGELVAAGQRAGYAALHERVVCLTCLSGAATDPAPDDSSRSRDALLPAHWIADEEVIAATLRALRGEAEPSWPATDPATLHVPTDWSTPRRSTSLVEPSAAPEQATTLPRRKGRTVPVPDADLWAPEPRRAATNPSDEAAVTDLDDGTSGLISQPTPPPTPPPATTTAPPTVEANRGSSRHVAPVVVDLRMPASAPRRRAGLFARMLTVRTFRAQQVGPRVSRPSAAVSALLDAATAKGVLSLHDRRVPGHRGRMEHLSVGPGGLYVVDVLHFKNASIEVRPAVDPDAATDDLVVGGRVLTAAVRAVTHRVEVLRLILLAAGLEDVPVTGALCFVDGLLPLSVADLQVGGMHVLRPSGLTALVAGPGVIGPRDRETLLQFVAQRLPAST